MSCLFCRKIYDSNDLNKPIGESHIQYDEKMNKFNLYSCAPGWYWSSLLRDVKFCPYCGERLA